MALTGAFRFAFVLRVDFDPIGLSIIVIGLTIDCLGRESSWHNGVICTEPTLAAQRLVGTWESLARAIGAIGSRSRAYKATTQAGHRSLNHVDIH